jgi:hypothetical protein
MMPNRHHAKWFRRGFAVTTWLLLPVAPILVMAACASTDETTKEPDETLVIPTSDAGGEASLDAEANDADAPLEPCVVGGPRGRLCTMPTPLTMGSVMSIAGRSKSDVWASGSDSLMMHWNGQTWTRLVADPGDADIAHDSLSKIFLTSDETWGISGTLVERRGIDPSTIRTIRVNLVTTFQALTGIAVLPQGAIYVSAGVFQPTLTRGTAPLKKLNFATGVLTNEPDPIHPVTKQAQQVWARASYLVPEKALWLVGGRGSVVRYPVIAGDAGAGDGGAPSLGQGVVVPLASDTDLFAAWGQGEHLWTAGLGGAILHYDGAEWHTEDTGTGSAIYSIFGFAPNDLWAAGDDGTVVHFDGSKWSPVDVGGYRGNLRAVWGSAPDDVWIGGEGAMFHWGALQ